MRRGTISSGFGEDKLKLSHSFVNKFIKVSAEDELTNDNILEDITTFFAEVIENKDEFDVATIIDKLSYYVEAYNSFSKEAEDESGGDLINVYSDALGKAIGFIEYIISAADRFDKDAIIEQLGTLLAKLQDIFSPCDEVPKTSRKVYASVDAIIEEGFVSQGTGIYKDADHHLWHLSREGEGYSINRVEDEDEIRAKKEKIASEKRSELVNIESDSSLITFLDDLSQSGVFYQKVSGNDSRATINIDNDDIATFNEVLSNSEVRVAEKQEDGRTDKVFSDEAVIVGISHYVNMGFDEKEAIKNFMESNSLDKEYELPIKDVLAKYYKESL